MNRALWLLLFVLPVVLPLLWLVGLFLISCWFTQAVVAALLQMFCGF